MKFFIATLILLLPLTAFAASHEHGTMKGMDHGSMAKDGAMIMVGDDTEDGVKGMAHLKDVSAAMSKMGMDATHHFMVLFADVKSGKPITEGTAAVKITGPDGKAADPVRLIAMEGHFGADVVLKQKGEYSFEVGTKLPDGQKRTFEFKQTLK
jgi:hypothetical protein